MGARRLRYANGTISATTIPSVPTRKEFPMKLNVTARLAACAIAMAALLFSGCESPDDDVDAYIYITPAGCELGVGRSRGRVPASAAALLLAASVG